MNAIVDITGRVERELARMRADFSQPPFSALPVLYREMITSYLSRHGKRLRPTLFIIGHDAYAPHATPHLYRSAVALELIHAFTLVHDDIVDRSPIRRGRPAMHTCLDAAFAKHPSAKFSGSDAAIIVGDMLYAIGLNRFLSVEADAERKLRAMQTLTKAAVVTACGELREMLDSLHPAAQTTARRLAQTAEWKTAHYSFACPLVTGATLAGARNADIETLRRYALSVGLAFQIRDDVLDLTEGYDPATGRQEFGDLREGKLTLPLWHALKRTTGRKRAHLQRLLKGGTTRSQRTLTTARDIIVDAGSIEYANAEIARYAGLGQRMLTSLRMAEPSRQLLTDYTAGLLGMEGNDHA